MAGYIVEQISGQPYYEYVQEHIFKPLDMKNTGIEPTYSDNLWVKSKLEEAEGYTYELIPIQDGLFYINLYPAGSAAGTLDDIVKFAKALLPNSDGSKKLFKNQDTLSEMLSPSLKYPDTDIDYVNHGLWSHEYNVQALGHGGNTRMYSTYLLVDPVSSVGTVIMTNQGSEFTYYYGLPPMIFGNVGKMASQEERSDVSVFEGLYNSARTIRNGIGKMYTIIGILPYLDDGNGNLGFDFLGLGGLHARQIAPNTFVVTQQAGSLEVNSLARYSNINGMKKLTSPYGETVEADGEIWVLVIAIIFLVISILWSTIVLIVSLIRFIIRKAKKRLRVSDIFKKYEIILCISIWLLVINIISVANQLLSVEATHLSIMVNVIVSIILAVGPIAYSILYMKKRSKLTSGKLQKVSYIITMVMGFAITISVLALEMYKL